MSFWILYNLSILRNIDTGIIHCVKVGTIGSYGVKGDSFCDGLIIENILNKSIGTKIPATPLPNELKWKHYIGNTPIRSISIDIVNDKYDGNTLQVARYSCNFANAFTLFNIILMTCLTFSVMMYVLK